MSRMLWAVTVLVAALAATAPTAARSQTFDGALRRALRTSTVPVLLPQPLPRVFGTVHSVRAISAGTPGYYVGFSPVAGCAGSLSCAFFHIAGTPVQRTGEPWNPRDRRVRLPDGSRAVFRPPDCSGAS